MAAAGWDKDGIVVAPPKELPYRRIASADFLRTAGRGLQDAATVLFWRLRTQSARNPGCYNDMF